MPHDDFDAAEKLILNADKDSPSADLNPDAILTAEFEYIAGTAAQATEDRARLTSFFLVAVGSLVAAVLSAQVETLQILSVYLAFAAFFFILALDGLLTILQLVRLRQAWCESVAAMNVIKEYYIRRMPAHKLTEAFLWRTSTIPARYKAGSISHLLAVQVALISAGMLGAATAFGGLALGQNWAIPAVMAAVAAFVALLALYRQQLKTTGDSNRKKRH